MTHEITKHACDHCGRAYSIKSNANRHEKKCFYDPRNQACVTCAHLKSYQTEDHYLAGGEDVTVDRVDIDCDIEKNIEDAGMCNGSIEKVYRHHCPFHETRTVKGTYKFGRTYIEEG